MSPRVKTADLIPREWESLKWVTTREALELLGRSTIVETIRHWRSVERKLRKANQNAMIADPREEITPEKRELLDVLNDVRDRIAILQRMAKSAPERPLPAFLRKPGYFIDGQTVAIWVPGIPTSIISNRDGVGWWIRDINWIRGNQAQIFFPYHWFKEKLPQEECSCVVETTDPWIIDFQDYMWLQQNPAAAVHWFQTAGIFPLQTGYAAVVKDLLGIGR